MQTRRKADVVADAAAAGVRVRPLEDAYKALGGRAEAVRLKDKRGVDHWLWHPVGTGSPIHTQEGTEVNQRTEAEDAVKVSISGPGAKDGGTLRQPINLREFTSVPCADVNHDDEASLRADSGNGAHAPQRQCTGRMCQRCHALDYACQCPEPMIARAS